MYTYNGIQFASLKEAADFIEKQLYVSKMLYYINDINDSNDSKIFDLIETYLENDSIESLKEISEDQKKQYVLYVNQLLKDMFINYSNNNSLLNDQVFVNSLYELSSLATWIRLQYDDEYICVNETVLSFEFKITKDNKFIIATTTIEYSWDKESSVVNIFEINDNVITESILQPLKHSVNDTYAKYYN